MGLLERENKVLNYLKNICDLEIPNPKYLGQPSESFPYPFQGYFKIPGQSGCYAQLTSEQRSQSIEPLAHFLKQIHSIDEENAYKIGADKPVFDRTNKPTVFSNFKDLIQKVQKRGTLQLNVKVFEQEMALADAADLSNENKVLVQGDLYCRHLMFNDKKNLTGIIDWGDVAINWSCVDLAVIHSFFETQDHPKFLDIYGAVSEANWQYARFLGIYSSMNLICYAQDIGDKILYQEAKGSLKRLGCL